MADEKIKIYWNILRTRPMELDYIGVEYDEPRQQRLFANGE